MNRTPTDYPALIANLVLTPSHTENTEIAVAVLTAYDPATTEAATLLADGYLNPGERRTLTLADLLTIGAEAVHALAELDEAYARREHGAIAQDKAVRRIASVVHVCTANPLRVFKPAEPRDPTAAEIAEHFHLQLRAAAHWRGDHIPTETDPTPPHGTPRPAPEICMAVHERGFRCSLDLGHPGDHQAATRDAELAEAAGIAASWPR